MITCCICKCKCEHSCVEITANEEVVSILDSIVPELSTSQIKLIRLGTLSTNKARPIETSVTEFDIRKVLRNEVKLNERHVKSSSDITKTPTDLYRKIK